MNDEPFSLIEYISENFIGILLLVLALFIICVVEYISRLNALIFSMPSPIPGIGTTTPLSSIPPSFTKQFKTKGKKFKK
jgi:hypothetical protein